ncbi:hypothetical protein EJB05_26678 [Eragrostis curvula]|uniref:Uncharacterized protein n=1 Tax=Eragrostis curvula TaxID=38414 RepID=A0A5J9ULY7_9POAL|nr:hypothetical protein EJB05_26678 [Eragrostis curvula]
MAALRREADPGSGASTADLGGGSGGGGSGGLLEATTVRWLRRAPQGGDGDMAAAAPGAAPTGAVGSFGGLLDAAAPGAAPRARRAALAGSSRR